MPRVPVTPRADTSEAIQFLGTAASAQEIADWLVTLTPRPAAGVSPAGSDAIFVSGSRVALNQWVIRVGRAVDVVSDADFNARFTRP